MSEAYRDELLCTSLGVDVLAPLCRDVRTCAIVQQWLPLCSAAVRASMATKLLGLEPCDEMRRFLESVADDDRCKVLERACKTPSEQERLAGAQSMLHVAVMSRKPLRVARALEFVARKYANTRMTERVAMLTTLLHRSEPWLEVVAPTALPGADGHAGARVGVELLPGLGYAAGSTVTQSLVRGLVDMASDALVPCVKGSFPSADGASKLSVTRQCSATSGAVRGRRGGRRGCHGRGRGRWWSGSGAVRLPSRGLRWSGS